MKTKLVSLFIASLAMLASNGFANSWDEKLADERPLLGHRSWIIIVELADPLQISPGIEVMAIQGEQHEAVGGILLELSYAKHVCPLSSKLSDWTQDCRPQDDHQARGAFHERDGMSRLWDKIFSSFSNCTAVKNRSALPAKMFSCIIPTMPNHTQV